MTRWMTVVILTWMGLLTTAISYLLLKTREGPKEQYQRALAEAEQQAPDEVAAELVTFPQDRPLAVNTWIPESQVGDFRAPSGQWRDHALEEIWVSVDPSVQKFCAAFVASHGRSLDRLTLRLEQRLGLPPQGGRWEFLEIRLSHPTQDVIFRPCPNPATDHADCSSAAAETSDVTHRNWLRRQYVASYEKSAATSYPWTARGYTFDWAPGLQPGEFRRFGESEFVIRTGAPIEVVREIDTLAYCAAQ